MKQIISFKKEIDFKTMISKITSIALDNNLGADKELISGDFIISGTYKMTEASQIDEEFSYKIPVEIVVDRKYDTTNLTFDIDDFAYEIVDEEKLDVKIDLLLDKLELKEEDERDDETEDLFLDTSESIPLEVDTDTYKDQELESVVEKITENVPNVSSVFTAFKDTDETFATYLVYIVREGDSLDKILLKYKITKEKLEEYNDLSEIKIGDKIIIPTSTNA